MGAVKSATVPCPECHGDGATVQLVGPGRDSRVGFGVEPDELVVNCPVCKGVGRVLHPSIPDAEYAQHLDGLADDASLEDAYQDHLFITRSGEELLSAPQPHASSPVRAHQRR